MKPAGSRHQTLLGHLLTNGGGTALHSTSSIPDPQNETPFCGKEDRSDSSPGPEAENSDLGEEGHSPDGEEQHFLGSCSPCPGSPGSP